MLNEIERQPSRNWRDWRKFMHMPGDAMDRATTALACLGALGLVVAGWG